MATIYRFIVEQRDSRASSGRSVSSGSKTGAAKKGRNVSIFGGEKGGVEHNRKMRAINPLLNKATCGIWEKGMRVGRAGLGLVTRNTETGKIGISGPAIAIIIAWAIQTSMKHHNKVIEKANKQNMQNYTQLEYVFGAIHVSYEVTSNFWTG